MTTTYNIADLKTPEMFADARLGHLSDFADKLRALLGREDMYLELEAEEGADISDVCPDADSVVGDNLINLHIHYADDPDHVSDKGAWYAYLAFPHVENHWGEWTNSFILFVESNDGDFLEEIAFENGNPKMLSDIVDRINYWFPAE
ncbi:hypothetical protein pEaSNUABM40_00265 [Erwinia phage pEa_SNUABM_40]|uniref:Uncharacterized protein n=1 Tax=Erwinia phage pEa_SNUABM_3 TaxID=2869552 RepID=A0AAE7XHN9_9CAUD|nr:hypothetical protein MPK68_gp262 [Erwinia phage pEa_SNUABM_3]QZE56797.1 hypothetical protein pEaSNUABM20_00261 [Erwinia phage pEa_SNUABM_20]QZE58481.1 hypothetical protein pEaSNUABM40_00265 [Erwinia phage pEa_SNUABM_40]UAW53042.1 hypothetical protein pEaSNUABM23_00260 [Erwinia phage pEa_SNUABM_23]UIW10937.1 hypothetical protein pEaSNUABM23_00260 [Erwinia phage pEa_SNUABM_31]QZE56459.1 hypothetical protein pEaSNUABM3_00262 [Erwinia phage pEa_SNUABM_3]